jgi:hypothetical protein
MKKQHTLWNFAFILHSCAPLGRFIWSFDVCWGDEQLVGTFGSARTVKNRNRISCSVLAHYIEPIRLVIQMIAIQLKLSSIFKGF